MPITARCPECGHKYRFDEKHVGRQAKCKNGHVFTVAPAIPAEATEIESSQPSERVAQAMRGDRTYRFAFLAILAVPVLMLAGGGFWAWYSENHATYPDPYKAAEAGCVRELKRMHLERKPLDEPHVKRETMWNEDLGTDANGIRCAYQHYESETPLQAAVSNGHLDAVVYLLQAGCNPWTHDAHATQSAVELAQSRTDILNAILEPANHKLDEGGSTLLHEAARANCPLGVRLLLEHGASVNAKDKRGRTAVYDAAYWGHNKCVELLLSHGADRREAERAHQARDAEEAKEKAKDTAENNERRESTLQRLREEERRLSVYDPYLDIEAKAAKAVIAEHDKDPKLSGEYMARMKEQIISQEKRALEARTGLTEEQFRLKKEDDLHKVRAKMNELSKGGSQN